MAIIRLHGGGKHVPKTHYRIMLCSNCDGKGHSMRFVGLCQDCGGFGKTGELTLKGEIDRARNGNNRLIREH